MDVTDLNNKYDGVIDQAWGGVTAVIYILWQSLFGIASRERLSVYRNLCTFLTSVSQDRQQVWLQVPNTKYLSSHHSSNLPVVQFVIFAYTCFWGKYPLFGVETAPGLRRTGKRLPLYKLCSHASLKGLPSPRVCCSQVSSHQIWVVVYQWFPVFSSLFKRRIVSSRMLRENLCSDLA